MPSTEASRALHPSDGLGLVACGDGKEVRAVAMIWDTGSKTGEVTGHTKQAETVGHTPWAVGCGRLRGEETGCSRVGGWFGTKSGRPAPKGAGLSHPGCRSVMQVISL